jgi:hypothetical protein
MICNTYSSWIIFTIMACNRNPFFKSRVSCISPTKETTEHNVCLVSQSIASQRAPRAKARHTAKPIKPKPNPTTHKPKPIASPPKTRPHKIESDTLLPAPLKASLISSILLSEKRKSSGKKRGTLPGHAQVQTVEPIQGNSLARKHRLQIMLMSLKNLWRGKPGRRNLSDGQSSTGSVANGVILAFSVPRMRRKLYRKYRKKEG